MTLIQSFEEVNKEIFSSVLCRVRFDPVKWCFFASRCECGVELQRTRASLRQKSEPRYATLQNRLYAMLTSSAQSPLQRHPSSRLTGWSREHMWTVLSKSQVHQQCRDVKIFLLHVWASLQRWARVGRIGRKSTWNSWSRQSSTSTRKVRVHPNPVTSSSHRCSSHYVSLCCSHVFRS